MLEQDRGFMHEGACRPGNPEGYDSVMWFPKVGQAKAAAKAAKICNTACPVRDKCRSYAVHFPLRLMGVWGGLTSKELHEHRMVLGVRSEREEYFSGLPLDSADDETSSRSAPTACMPHDGSAGRS